MDDDGWIRTSLVTDGHTRDPTVVPELLEQLAAVELKRFVADGIYDNATVYGAIAEHQPIAPSFLSTEGHRERHLGYGVAMHDIPMSSEDKLHLDKLEARLCNT